MSNITSGPVLSTGRAGAGHGGVPTQLDIEVALVLLSGTAFSPRLFLPDFSPAVGWLSSGILSCGR